ncbi:hypothetical protein HBI23_191110 [Parastagonospora nodorum]|nr:hypothetical protein HBI47_187260 [Parastagonospora nodorum]KAH5643658.1 hypothetical protein HBI23_191110 [Parastagonospora nodorum]KAH6206229.1 hypothetical protein HBI43_189070 [Parastagonospora nodorum]KAH6244974.1 hypothetical protein HBI42_201000 [Parastagonospora nodorum]
MLFTAIAATLLSLASWTPQASAKLAITADHHSWGGVNYPMLQFFTREHRDNTIRALVDAKVRVVRLFIRPDSQHSDPEHELGGFDKSLLDQFDQTMAAIHHISKGQMKVIIVPHDAHALRGTADVPCDAYCKKLEGAFLDFYSLDEYRELYKQRLDVLFKHYPSQAFDGRPWSELSEVILGVDLQNQPFSGIWPIPAGESWLCDIATHLKFNIGLDQANIAVISGGISGPQSVDGIQNFPDSAMECAAIDVIGIHSYFKKDFEETAGTSWAKMFVPGNTLTARMKGKKGEDKLLLVEEWSYVHSKFGHFYKKEAIFDQGNALNYRGIPWLYSHLTTLEEGLTARINPLRTEFTSWAALKDVLQRSYTARSNFDWSKHLPPPPDAALTNVTAVQLNPYIPEQSDCTFGCEGHLCDAADGCAPNLICKNSICQQNTDNQPGKIGDQCNSKKICQTHLRCEKGECQECSVRPSIQPKSKRQWTGTDPPPQDPSTKVIPNSLTASCHTDSLPTLFSHRTPHPICLAPTPNNPCEKASHCDVDSYCNWGVCTRCTSGDSCLGAKCRSNNKCKTGFCNNFGRCDYAGQKKIISGPGARGKSRNSRVPGVPKGHERGPAKVRDEAMRVNIPGEKAEETARATATATA